MMPIFLVTRRPVSGDASAARSESSVYIPYSGPSAKSAFSPSVSAITTTSPASSSGATIAVSTAGIRPPSDSPPAISYDGSSLGLSES